MSQIAHSVPGAHRIWCLATDDVVIVPHVKPYGVRAMLLPGTVGGTGMQGSVRGANGTLAGSKSDAGGGATVPMRESRDNADLDATAHRGLCGPAQDGAGTTRIHNGVPLDIARPIRGFQQKPTSPLVGRGGGGMVHRNRALHADVSRGFGDVSAVDVRMSEFLSAISTSVPINVTRVNMTGGSTFLPEYSRASVPAAHPPERLYFPPSNAHSHVSNEVHGDANSRFT